MTAYSITVSNRLNLLQAASLWNVYNWNAFNWGYGTANLQHDVQHLISESLVSTSSAANHAWIANVSINETLVVSDEFPKEVIKGISETLTPTSDMSSETLQDSNGYYYVFASNAQNAEDRDIPSYASGSNPSASYTSAAVSATSWS